MTEPTPKPRAKRGKPFAPGNAGKPKGARNRITRVVEDMLDGDAKKLTRKAIDLALAGDSVALRLCLERLAPVRRERTIRFNLPAIKSATDQPKAIAAILAGVAIGELTPGEAQALSNVIEQHRRSVETSEIIDRLEKLEGQGQ